MSIEKMILEIYLISYPKKSFMRKLLFLIFQVCSLSSFAQYQVGHTTITFNDPARTGGFGSGGGTGRQIQTEIYYPANAAGDNVAVASGQFPVITFGHGFAMSWDAYANIWQHYIPKGYIIAFPRTEGSLIPSPSHGDFGTDLKQVSEKMLALNSNSSSIFSGKILQNAAIMGHSMGGGASFLAAANNTTIKTVIGLAPAETNPSAISASPNVSVPALVFSGSADGVTPPADHHIPIYNGLMSACKSFVSILGGAHCYYANTNFNCDLGEGTSSPNISITREVQQTKTFAILDPWLDYVLKGNCPSYATFQNALVSTTGTQNQTICPSVSTVTISASGSTLTANSSGNVTAYQWNLNGTPITGASNQTYVATQNGNYTVDAIYSFGCASSSAYAFSNGTTGVLELKNNITVTPNPVKTVLKISSSIEGFYDIQILDLNGRILKNKISYGPEILFDCESLNNGIYILRILGSDNNFQTKFIKE
jgi:dienelactone hydrolase